MGLVSSSHSNEASPEQIQASKQKIYDAYQKGDFPSLWLHKSALWGRVGLATKKVADTIKEMQAQKNAQVAMGLKGEELWNYAQSAGKALENIGNDVQQMYNNAIAAGRRKLLPKKFGGQDNKLGD